MEQAVFLSGSVNPLAKGKSGLFPSYGRGNHSLRICIMMSKPTMGPRNTKQICEVS